MSETVPRSGTAGRFDDSLDRRVPMATMVNGEWRPFTEGALRIGDVEVHAELVQDGGALVLEWRVRNPTRRTVLLEDVAVLIAAHPRRVIEHGWQSWSVVRRCAPDDRRATRRRRARWRTAMYLADPRFAGDRVSGDQFLVDDAGVTGFVATDSHFGTVSVTEQGIEARALLDGVTVEPGGERVLDPLWIATGDPGTRYSEYARAWGERSNARAAAAAPLGWCSWYEHRSEVTPAHVRAALRSAHHQDLDVVQIDDGYQAAIGAWRSPSGAWNEGVATIAGEIRDAGVRAGIWTAPFITMGGRHVECPADAVLRDARKHPVGAMHHPSLWGGWALAIDTTHPAALDHIATTFATLKDDGFDYFKVDFLYAAALGGRRFDPTATRAQALRRGLDAIRAGIGDESFLVACGCPFGPAVGVVDAMRVSCDVDDDWSRRGRVVGFAETESGVRNAVRASVLRAPLHRRLWINDPDCVLLGPDRSIRPRDRDLLLDVVRGLGGLAMVSDDLDTYTAAEWDAVARLRAASPAGHEPRDVVDPFAPVVHVRSDTTELEVDWRGNGRASFRERAGAR